MNRAISIAVVFTLIVGGFILTIGVSDLGPGPLSSVHEEQKELSGSQSCTACHGAEGQDFTAACSKCHEVIAKQIATSTGFHGTIEAGRAKQCEKCHLEHLGADNPLVGDRAFVRSGLDKGTRAFAHKGLHFDLVGRHLELDCDKCHELAFAPRLHKGEVRFLGLANTCTSCHKDPHDGKLGDCNACHGQSKPFPTAAAFEHDKRFPLTGGHARVACQKCHDANFLKGTLAGAKASSRPVRECVECHESPHSREYLDGVTRATGKPSDRSCTLCHSSEHESFASADQERTRALHDATGFRLLEPHEKVACRGCHSGPADQKNPAFAVRYPGGRSLARCESCHDDPHGGQFLARGDARTCTDCHDRQHFVPHLFDAGRHQRTAFPLRRAHAKVECNKCHEVDGSQVRRFRGTGTTCISCHESPHARQFSGKVAADNDCLACHGEDHFRPAQFTLAQHSKVFPLAGGHLAVGCNTCHKPRRGARTDANGRYPVSALIFDGTPDRCEDCHLDVHDKAFDRAGLPRQVDGKVGCERCHTVDHFELERASEFRHGFWTGFELTGAHATAKCDGCHPPGKPTHGGTRVMARAAKDCASCHTDPHAGQFRANGATDCRRCHDTHPGWKPSGFDHERDSQFKLGDQHRNVACNRCHVTYKSQDRNPIVRYKPLSVTCRSCHLGEVPRRR